MKKLTPTILYLFAALTYSGCGTGKDVSAATENVTVFHRQLDAQDFLTIYNGADPKLRQATKAEEFVAFLTAIHNKLGNVETATQQGYFVNFTSSGTMVRLTYHTKFGGGDAQEVFVWGKTGNDFKLVGYNINSNALILK